MKLLLGLILLVMSKNTRSQTLLPKSSLESDTICITEKQFNTIITEAMLGAQTQNLNTFLQSENDKMKVDLKLNDAKIIRKNKRILQYFGIGLVAGFTSRYWIK